MANIQNQMIRYALLELELTVHRPHVRFHRPRYLALPYLVVCFVSLLTLLINGHIINFRNIIRFSYRVKFFFNNYLLSFKIWPFLCPVSLPFSTLISPFIRTYLTPVGVCIGFKKSRLYPSSLKLKIIISAL